LIKKVSFIGLGVMGFPMAGWLSRSGYDVVVFNRTIKKAEKWCQLYNGRMVDNIEDGIKDSDAVLTCLGKDSDLREIVLSDQGIIKRMKPGSFYIDHTTASADIAREIYNVSNKNNISFYDAPVSGGQAGAENGALTIMVGGDEKNFKSVNLLISNYAKRVCLMGKTGSGQLAKMANQIAIAGIIQGLSEALSFSKNAGLEVKTLIEAISQGAAQSWQMDNRWETMINGEFNFGFAVEWMRKDLKICFEEASRNGSELPLANLIDKYYQEIEEMGGERWDTSSLIARLNLDTSQSDE
tara:strand:- start:862 stop:1752 length:891 start_codon:yes stop_codon:yes gene_type:complete